MADAAKLAVLVGVRGAFSNCILSLQYNLRCNKGSGMGAYLWALRLGLARHSARS